MLPLEVGVGFDGYFFLWVWRGLDRGITPMELVVYWFDTDTREYEERRSIA